jgi:long-chain acyl-CoA synthetase
MGDETAPEGFLTLEALVTEAKPLDGPGHVGSELLGIFYTGGTTGRSKGVMLTHANLCSSGLSMLSEGVFEEGCVALHVAPMFHLADMLMTTCVIIRGGTHVFLPAFSPDAVLDLVADHKVTDTLVVPAMLQALVDFPGRYDRDAASLHNILYGASPAPESLLRRALEAFPKARLTQGYGMTESAALIGVLPWQQHLNAPGQPNRLRAAGRSTFDVLVRIVDANNNEVPRGEVGEIVARGPNVMQGYLNLPEESAKALQDGWLHTGDLAWMDDEGYFFIVDRAKDMIISGGENIYSSEVENAIASHPAVAMNAVIGVPHEHMGEAVHAVVVLRPGGALSLDELQSHCRKSISGYKLPRSLELRDALPMSGAGKVLKTELRQPYWSGHDRAVS